AVAAHQRRLDALVAHLAHDQAGGIMQAAPVDEVGIGRLELGDEGGEILVVLVDALIHDLLDALGVHGLAGFFCEALAVGGRVVFLREQWGRACPLNFAARTPPATTPCWSSRPHTRNMFHMPGRSVTLGLVAAGVITSTPFSR